MKYKIYKFWDDVEDEDIFLSYGYEKTAKCADHYEEVQINELSLEDIVEMLDENTMYSLHQGAHEGLAKLIQEKVGYTATKHIMWEIAVSGGFDDLGD